MTMAFITAKAAIVKLLGDKAAGRYRVVGYEKMPTDASDFQGNQRSVRVFYSGGDFDESAGSSSTPCMHDVVINLEMVVAASSEIDLGVITDPESTEAQRVAALAAVTPGAMTADSEWDKFADILWNIVMGANNKDFGLAKYSIRKRWVDRIRKDRLIPLGEQAVLTGFLRLNFRVEETATDATSSTVFSHNHTDFGILGDTVQKCASEI